MHYQLCIMNYKLCIIALVSVMILSSCTGHDYRDAIPKNVQALMSVDFASDDFPASKLKTDLEQAGVDFSEKAFLFETVEGNFGLCARIENDAKLKEWIRQKTNEKLCQPLTESAGIEFVFYNDSWVIGYKDPTVLIIGPVLPDMQKQIQMQISRLISQDGEQGGRTTKMFQALDSLQAPIRLIAKIAALPENIALPLTIGLSKNTNLSHVCLLAEIHSADSLIHINGQAISFNKHTNEKLRKADKVYRPISSKTTTVNRHAFLSFITNVQGPTFLDMIQRNQTMKGLLSGINASFDVNSVIDAIDGDMVIATSINNQDRIPFAMKAEIKDKAFLKQNWYTPSDHFFYATKDLDNQTTAFSCSNDKDIADQHYDYDISKYLAKQRLAIVLHLPALHEHNAHILTKAARHLFGEDMSTILYTLK